ncbi:hypothetical protein GOP47_0008013 [Adiantum capillus-veneris]|uniref:B box-type domain-containing protein n=1 Tax=Adiantum capillus-veneris TaxID=13818 RepID=A0A9D4ZJU9_ADICA|nr:hypothetical protein GOP47_0008013 [Adiantum capillus-veneris]
MEVPLPTLAFTPCELCRAPAHVLCPSDDAFLCRPCDGLVHGANFLVARHHRSFLCCGCGCPTAMGASGASLPAASPLLCVNCPPMMEVAELCYSSISESSECSSELTSDCEYEWEFSPHPFSTSAGTGSFLHKCSGPLQLHVPSAMSDAISDVDEEELSFMEVSSSSPFSAVEEVEGNDSSAHTQVNWRVCQRQR